SIWSGRSTSPRVRDINSSSKALVLRPGHGEPGEVVETEARRRTRGASSGGVPLGTSSGGATRLRVAARGSAAAAVSMPRSEHLSLRSLAGALDEAGDRLRRGRGLLQPVLEALLLELDLRGLEVGVVRPDRLDELAVPRVARVGGNHVVVRHLLCARTREPKHDSHESSPSWGTRGISRASAACQEHL